MCHAPMFKPALSPLQQLGNPEEEFYGFVGDNPTGMAVSSNGEIFLSDNGTNWTAWTTYTSGRYIGRC